MLLSLLTQGVLDITSGVIIWTLKKSYNVVSYFFYKNDIDEYIMIKEIEYEEIKEKLKNQNDKITELEKLIK
tara:strand:- start:423 stop:638 length:216 start_codon:yes stop_codon:yes gene_type:complete